MTDETEMPSLQEGNNATTTTAAEAEQPLDAAAISAAAATAAAEEGGAGGAPGEKHQTRAEKKNRKAMAKFGMQLVPGIIRITMKRGRNFVLVFSQPEVYKSGDTYLIFGEAKFEDTNAQLQQNAAQQLRAAQAQFSQQKAEKESAAASSEAAASAVADLAASAASASAAASTSETTPVDASGIDPKDIELVMGQAGVSREAAIGALSRSKGDIVNAIMELTV